jgi:chemotaxis protein CheD
MSRPGLPHRASRAVMQVALMPGELHCSAEPTLLVTLLGSCVAVCLWDKTRRIGGMNHFVLPSDPGGQGSARYGDIAMRELEAGLHHLGSRLVDLQAKVFGGAAVLPFMGNQSVGSSNVRFALDRLSRHRIRVTAQRTGGILGQQVQFHTGTGDAFVRYIPATARETV